MATKQASGRPAFATVESFLSEVRGNVKAAEAHTEPGSIGGATTHPVKSVDDNTSAATEGARSAENTKDVKKDQGSPSVDSTAEAKAKTAALKRAGGPGAEDHLQLGTTVAATGEDPENETGKAKPGKDDPGSSHPARTDNASLDGFKYAGDLQNAPLTKLAEMLQDLGDAICADLTVQGVEVKQAGDGTVTQVAPAQQKQAGQIDPALAQQVGWQMAGILTGTLDKQATDAVVVEQIDTIIKFAEDDADRTAAWLGDFFAQKQAQARAQKRAEAGLPPEAAAGGGGGGEDIAAALGGGGAPGGAPPEDPAAGGGLPPEAGGEAGGGGLQALLEQLGISEEELMAAIQEEAAGGGAPGGPPAPGGEGGAPAGPGGPGGGLPPEAAGMPPGGAGAGMEVAAGDRRGRAATPPPKEAVASYVREVVSRSRAQKAAAAQR